MPVANTGHGALKIFALDRKEIHPPARDVGKIKNQSLLWSIVENFNFTLVTTRQKYVTITNIPLSKALPSIAALHTTLHVF